MSCAPKSFLSCLGHAFTDQLKAVAGGLASAAFAIEEVSLATNVTLPSGAIAMTPISRAIVGGGVVGSAPELLDATVSLAGLVAPAALELAPIALPVAIVGDAAWLTGQCL